MCKKGHFGHYSVQFDGQDIFLNQYRRRELSWCTGEFNLSLSLLKNVQLS